MPVRTPISGVVAGLTAFTCLQLAVVAQTPGRFNGYSFNDGAGNSLSYQLYVPAGYSPSASYPLVVSLHGAGERRSTNTVPEEVYPTQVFVTPEAQGFQPHFVLHPWCPPGRQWVDQEFGEGSYDLAQMPASSQMRALQALITDLLARFPAIHPDRVVITGLSMGGYGTLDAVARQPGRFAGALAVCGGGPVPQAAAGIYGQTPLWLVHGDADNIVPVSGSRELVAAVLGAGGRVRYREYPGAGHDTWTPTYGDFASIRWLLTRVRNQSPAGNAPPSINLGAVTANLTLPSYVYSPSVTISDTDGPSDLLYTWWHFVDGPTRPLFTPQVGGATSILFPKVGTYRLRVLSDDGGTQVSRELTVNLQAQGGTLPDLLAHWKFDEGAGLSVTDATGRNAAGELISAAGWTTDTPHGTGHALRFFSPRNVLRIPASPYLSPLSNRFTLAFWAKTVWDGFIWHQPGALSVSTAGGLRFTFLGNGNGAWIQPGAPASGNAWVHVALTYDGSVGRVYFNGVLRHTNEVELNLNASSSPLLIGGAEFVGDDGAENIQGALDDVRLYSRPLTPTEILALLAPPPAGFAGWIQSLPAPPPAHLRGREDDPDGDGLANFLEYAFGGDPMNPLIAPHPVSTEGTGPSGERLVILSYRKAIPGVTYSVLSTTDLFTGAWSAVTSPETFDPVSGLHQRSAPIPDVPGRLFLRVSVNE